MSDTEPYRPNWDDYFMAMARLAATRSTCDRLAAGAVIVKNKRIISTGYNGSPPGLAHCDDVGHLLEDGHCVRTIHAEHNAILQAATAPGASTTGSTMYTKYTFCIHCAKYIIAAGIVRVVYGKIYRNAKAMDYLRQARIQIDEYKTNPAWNKKLAGLVASDIEVRNPAEGDVALHGRT